MLIHDVKFDTKDDPILQNSSQEPSTSSMYEGVLNRLIIILGSWNLFTTKEWQIMLIHDVTFDIRDNPTFQNSSQEPPRSSKYDCVLDALIIMIGNWKDVHSSKMTYNVDSWCKIFYLRGTNPPKPQSGTINVLQVWLCSWCNFNHVRELNIGIQLNNDTLWLFVMSNLIPNMIYSSKTPARNCQCPPSMTVFLMHL